MGILASKSEGSKNNDKINAALRKDSKKQMLEVKLLLLGTGESGKSTFAKQLKILHMQGFTKEELVHYKNVLQSNVLVGIATLVERAWEYGYSFPELKSEANLVVEESNTSNKGLSAATIQAIKKLWAHKAIQDTYVRRAQFQLHGSVPYIVDNIDRITKPDELPNDEDVIQCRVRTTGIVELTFEMNKIPFRVVDVGGQRSERRKWLHCFDGVTAILFCVALSEYDEKLCEDTKVNRMQEALTLFQDIANKKFFADSSMILLLNKKDLFEDKIKNVPLTCCFPDYNGPSTFDDATKFIEGKFLERVEAKDKQIFVHRTCATDTDNVKHVFAAVKMTVLENNLKDLNF
eukprot:TRINITY_DN1484_c0_g1_i1.p1 TRINITY_DN1484_c0_g1~~TRINITY_DN1484_c0_g1_i1.p1  ORF type:complete len:348 (-),score=76.88 TRINITY_DN1484_c0_g1_i1:87-1130(-)